MKELITFLSFVSTPKPEVGTDSEELQNQPLTNQTNRSDSSSIIYESEIW